MIDIKIWSDFTCPYCYLGEMHLFNAIRDLGVSDRVTVSYKAFELDPTMPAEMVMTVEERMAEKCHLKPLEIQHRLTHIYELGRSLGLDFDMKNQKFSNTRLAHRLMKLAAQRYDTATVYALNTALFDAVFSRGISLGNTTELTNIALEAGLKKQDVQELIGSDIYTDEVIADEREAESRRIGGVPNFVFNDKRVVPGMISTEDFKDLLKEELDNKNVAKELHDAHPASCNRKGCSDRK